MQSTAELADRELTWSQRSALKKESDLRSTSLAGGFCVLLYRVLHGLQSEAVEPEATVADGSAV